MKKILCLLTIIGMSSAHAEQWEVPIGKKPSNAPTKNTTKASPKLDFIAFKTGNDGSEIIGIRVRNGKHKMGGATITVGLGGADMVVQRIDIMKAKAKIISQGDGEHLLDTFISSEKNYEIFVTVSGGEIGSNIIVKSKGE